MSKTLAVSVETATLTAVSVKTATLTETTQIAPSGNGNPLLKQYCKQICLMWLIDRNLID